MTRISLGVGIGLSRMPRRVELALHHIEEHRDCPLPKFRFRDKRHLEERSHQSRNKLNFGLT